MIPISVMNRIGALERLVAEQSRRIASLEAGGATPKQRRCNADRVAHGAQLREAIAGILAHPGAGELSAKHVRTALEAQGWRPLPALRTIRLHIQHIRGNGNAAVLPPR